MLRKLLTNFATYGLGDIVLKAATVFILPIYTRLLSVEEYGTWNILVTASGMLFALLALGGDAVYLRFFFVADTPDKRRLIASTWFGFLAFWSLGFVLLIVPFSRDISHALTGTSDNWLLIVLTLFTVPVSIINSLCAQSLINEFRAKSAVTINLLTSILVISLNILGILLFGILGFFIASILVNLIVLPIRLWTIRHLLRPRFSFPLLIEMIRYGLPIVPSSLAYWVFMSSDRILLGNLSDLRQVGLYAVANQIASTMNLVIGALQQAWTPQAIQIYETEPTRAAQVYGQVMSYILIVFGILSVAVSAFGREILIVLSSSDYYDASPAIGPLALGFLAYAAAQITHLGISVKRKTHFLALVSWIAAIVNVGLNLILIPYFGFLAAAWSTAAAYACWTIGYFFISQRLFPTLYETRRILPVIGLTIVFVATAPLLPEIDFLPSLVLKGIYCLVFIGLLIGLKVVDQREWTAASLALRGIRSRISS